MYFKIIIVFQFLIIFEPSIIQIDIITIILFNLIINSLIRVNKIFIHAHLFLISKHQLLFIITLIILINDLYE